MEIGNLLKNRLLNIKVIPTKSLFPLERKDFINWLPKMLCPICQKKLYWNSKKTIARCKSKISNDKFVITAKALEKYKI